MNQNFKDEIFIASMERTIRRLWILCIILIVALISTNAAWIWYESQFEDITTTESIDAVQDGKGVNIVGGKDVNYGSESKDNSDNQNKTPESRR